MPGFSDFRRSPELEKTRARKRGFFGHEVALNEGSEVGVLPRRGHKPLIAKGWHFFEKHRRGIPKLDVEAVG